MHAGSPVGLWQRPGPATLQHTLVRRAHTSSCSSGTQAHSEGSRREAAVAARRDPAHATQAAAEAAGEESDCYLFSPSSPGTSRPWPFVFRGAGSGGRAGRMDQGSGCLCRNANIAFCGLRGRWAKEPAPQLDPGGRRAGRVPGRGAVWRAAVPGWAVLRGPGIHCPLLRVAAPLSPLPAQVESRQADPALGEGR